MQTKIFKISYYIISEVLKNEMIKRIEVRCTLNSLLALLRLREEIDHVNVTYYPMVFFLLTSLSSMVRQIGQQAYLQVDQQALPWL